MKTRIAHKILVYMLITSVFSFFTITGSQAQQLAVGNQLVELNGDQFAQFSQSQGVSFSSTPPAGVDPSQSIVSLPDGNIAVKVYSQAGGGWVTGTPANIAAGLNSVGATIGATPASFAVGSAGLSTGMLTAIIAGTVVVVGGIAAAMSASTQNQNQQRDEQNNKNFQQYIQHIQQHNTTTHH